MPACGNVTALEGRQVRRMELLKENTATERDVGFWGMHWAVRRRLYIAYREAA